MSSSSVALEHVCKHPWYVSLSFQESQEHRPVWFYPCKDSCVLIRLVLPLQLKAPNLFTFSPFFLLREPFLPFPQVHLLKDSTDKSTHYFLPDSFFSYKGSWLKKQKVKLRDGKLTQAWREQQQQHMQDLQPSCAVSSHHLCAAEKVSRKYREKGENRSCFIA